MNAKERFYNRYFGPRGLVTAVRVSLYRENTATALALICACVESMTYLGLLECSDVVCSHDFAAWVRKYLQPARIGVSPEDLWSVRNALLNGYVAQRSISRSPKPREILFAWGKYYISEGMQLDPGSKWHQVMTIRADELYKSLVRAAEEFGAGYISESENERIVGARLNKIFGNR
ncbi:MAG: hypothetical protein ABFD54_00220 [Armatimonadota bacterium]|nr:hypothetical protein [bacterium]